MAQLFNRVVQVELTKVKKPPYSGRRPDPEPVDFFHSQGLHITFNVEKSDKKNEQKAEVRIYNLSQETRNKLSQLEKDKYVKILLKAGYQPDRDKPADVADVWRGPVTRMEHRYEYPDWVTVFHSDVGSAELKNTPVGGEPQNNTAEESSGEDVSNNIFDSIKAKAGVIKRELENKSVAVALTEGLANAIFNKGSADRGSASKVVDSLATSMGLDWHVDAEEIVLTEKPGAGKGWNGREETIDMSRVANPERTRVTEKGEGDKEKTFVGWNLKTLLWSRITPRTRIKITSSGTSNVPNNTLVLVKKITHTGDTHSGDFVTQLETIDWQ